MNQYRNLQSLADRYISLYQQDHKIPFGSRPRIVVGDARRWAQAYEEEEALITKHRPRHAMRSVAAEHYRTIDLRMLGLSNQMVVNEDRLRESPAEIRAGLAHDLVHVLQNNLRAAKPAQFCGLNWMTDVPDLSHAAVLEGLADALSFDLLSRHKDEFPQEYAHQKGLIDLYKAFLEENRPQLARKSNPKSEKEEQQYTYALGFSYVMRQLRDGRTPQDILANPPKTTRELIDGAQID
jgi:hypothetical protein